MAESTNYSKDLITGGLVVKLTARKATFETCIVDMGEQFKKIQKNWIEGDKDAEMVLQKFEQQYLAYKKKLQDAVDIIDRFLTEINGQVDKYAEAESSIKVG